MRLSIKKRIHWSFYILASIFVINGITIIATLTYNNKLTKHISEVADPSLKDLYGFREILLQSQMYTTNWVFLRSNQEDKEALTELQLFKYPALKTDLLKLSPKWLDQKMAGSLKEMFRGVDDLVSEEKFIKNTLQKFDDYDDPVKKFGAEEKLENEIIPRTNVLMTSLVKLLTEEQEIREQEEQKLENSSIYMRILISVFAVFVISLAIFLSVYMAKIIIRPINYIIDIVNDLGKGVIRRIDYKANGDEMGKMIQAVHQLSHNQLASAMFAHEIGNRNFNAVFEPLSEEDVLGKSLVAMRDNLKETDERLNEAQNIAHLGSWERDLTTNHLIWSDEIFRIYDTNKSTFDPHLDNAFNLIHPEDKERFAGKMKQMLNDHEPYSCEFRITTLKGNAKVIYLQAKAFLNEKGEVVKTFGTLQDITEQKKSQLALENAHAEMETLFRNIEEVFFSVGFPDFKLLQMSPACENVFGYPVEDFRKKSSLWYDVVLEEDKKIINDNNAVMYAGKSFTQEYRIHHKDGSVRWVETKIKPTLDSNGQLIRIDGVTADVTKKKEVEEALQANNAELKKTNSELDKFVYSVSHDLRAPLTSMLGVIQLSEVITQEEMTKKHLAMLKKSVNKLDSFIVDILNYSRNARIEVRNEEVNFKEILADVTDNLKYMGGSNRKVDIRTHINNGVCFKCDKSRLNVVLNNLISNAIRYQNPRAETPFVEINVDLTEEEAQIIIKDNGIGIDKSSQQKVFEMFYRVSENSVGSGLGLYLVKETIDKMKGKIEIDSELGKGTTFSIHIPNN